MSHLCANTVATWFVDVQGRRPRPGSTGMPPGPTCGDGCPGFSTTAVAVVNIHASFAAAAAAAAKKKPKRKANTVHPCPALHAQK